MPSLVNLLRCQPCRFNSDRSTPSPSSDREPFVAPLADPDVLVEFNDLLHVSPAPEYALVEQTDVYEPELSSEELFMPLVTSAGDIEPHATYAFKLRLSHELPLVEVALDVAVRRASTAISATTKSEWTLVDPRSAGNDNGTIAIMSALVARLTGGD